MVETALLANTLQTLTPANTSGRWHVESTHTTSKPQSAFHQSLAYSSPFAFREGFHYSLRFLFVRGPVVVWVIRKLPPFAIGLNFLDRFPNNIHPGFATHMLRLDAVGFYCCAFVRAWADFNAFRMVR